MSNDPPPPVIGDLLPVVGLGGGGTLSKPRYAPDPWDTMAGGIARGYSDVQKDPAFSIPAEPLLAREETMAYLGRGLEGL